MILITKFLTIFRRFSEDFGKSSKMPRIQLSEGFPHAFSDHFLITFCKILTKKLTIAKESAALQLIFEWRNLRILSACSKPRTISREARFDSKNFDRSWV